MNCYLVDYENVKVAGLNGVADLTRNDIVNIFYSKNADSLTFDMYEQLNKSPAKIYFHKVEVGRQNALDFQLSSYLGFLISKNTGKNINYYIVTKDKGFTSLISFWKDKKSLDINLVIDITGSQEVDLDTELRTLISQVSESPKVADIVIDIINKCDNKNDLHNMLVKEYPGKDRDEASEKAHQIYKAIKAHPLIRNKKGK